MMERLENQVLSKSWDESQNNASESSHSGLWIIRKSSWNSCLQDYVLTHKYHHHPLTFFIQNPRSQPRVLSSSSFSTQTGLFEPKHTQLPTCDLCPSFFPPFSIRISKVTHNRVCGSNTNLPSLKLPFLPLNYPLTGPPVLGLGKYHSHVSSLLYISGEHPRTGLSPSQPPPSCPARESLAYPRSLEDTKKFYKLEKSRKQNHPKLLFVIWRYMQNLRTRRLYKSLYNVLKVCQRALIKTLCWGKYVKLEINFPNIPL